MVETSRADGGRPPRTGGRRRMGAYLRRRFLVFLCALGGLSLTAYVVFMMMFAGQERLAGLVNDLGRQRMLAMRISATISRSDLLENPDGWRVSVAKDLASMQKVFRTLPDRAAAARSAEAIHPILYEEPYELRRVFTEFAARVTALTKGAEPTDQRLRDLLALTNGPLLDGLEALVNRVETRGQDMVVSVQHLATAGEVLYLGLLLLLGYRHLWPLSRGVQDNLDRIGRLESFQRSIVDGLADGLVLLDPKDHTAKLLNPAAREIFAMAGDGPLSYRALVPALAGHPVDHLVTWTRKEVDGVRSDGAPLHLEVTVRRVVSGQLVAMVRDVTEVKENQARLHSFHEVLEQAPVSIVITDAEGTIEYVNPRFCEVTGYEREEVIGQNPRIFQSGRTPAELYHRLWGSLKAGRQWRCEIQNRRKDGSLFWEFQAISPLRDSRGQVVQYLAVKEDITAQKEWQATVVRAMEEAQRANQAKSDFLAGMSHELRTPLNAIIGYSELMLMEPAGPLGSPTYTEYLGAVVDSGKHLLQLINDLLDISKVEANRMELDEDIVLIPDLIEDSEVLVRERAQRGGVELRRAVPPGLPPVQGDGRRLKQVLLNLLTNAVKFTPEGHAVTVSAHVADSGAMVIRVTDQGCGIREEDIPKVLQPFGQVTNSSPLLRSDVGTGLGLPLARRLVELHGGLLNLESVFGEGTTVTVTLPPQRVVRDRGDVREDMAAEEEV